MTMEFRKAQPDDLARLQHIAHQNIDSFYRDALGDQGVEHLLSSGEADRYIANSIDDCTVMYDTDADSDQQIIAFAVCKQDLITLLMVSTTRHRQGIGSQLLTHCEQQLLSDFAKIRLESFEGNKRGNRFYEKNHWSLQHRSADEHSGVNKYTYVKHASS